MILLRPDCLVFRTAQGQQVPCSVREVAAGLIGTEALASDSLLEQASEAVLHYFKSELGLSAVSIEEFSFALAKVLRSLGLKLAITPLPPRHTTAQADLLGLAAQSREQGFELDFYPRLRAEMRKQILSSPRILHFSGLRPCIKYLLGARRWNERCRQAQEQMVQFLRGCLQTEPGTRGCVLVVR